MDITVSIFEAYEDLKLLSKGQIEVIELWTREGMIFETYIEAERLQVNFDMEENTFWIPMCYFDNSKELSVRNMP